MKSQKGFSLIELLIVVAVILVISAIALPAIANSMRASNEAAVVGTLRSMTSAEQSFKNTFGSVADTAAHMGGTACDTGAVSATAACDISDNAFASGADAGYVKSSYNVKRLTPAGNGYVWIANPDGGILSGRRDFCNYNGTIHATAVGTVGTITDAASCLAALPLGAVAPATP